MDHVQSSCTTLSHGIECFLKPRTALFTLVSVLEGVQFSYFLTSGEASRFDDLCVMRCKKSTRTMLVEIKIELARWPLGHKYRCFRISSFHGTQFLFKPFLAREKTKAAQRRGSQRQRQMKYEFKLLHQYRPIIPFVASHRRQAQSSTVKREHEGKKSTFAPCVCVCVCVGTNGAMP